MIRLPSSSDGRPFETVGWFHLGAGEVRDWLLGSWSQRASEVDVTFDQLRELTAVSPRLRRRVLVPVDDWTLLLTDGPLGTDPAGMPALIAQQLRVTTVRAVCSPNGSGRSGGRVLEVFGAQGPNSERHVYAMKDGSRWKFGEFGTPFDFECVEDYSKVRIADRFTEDHLFRYLDALGVPRTTSVQLEKVIVVE
jgi:hypothetical protein